MKKELHKEDVKNVAFLLIELNKKTTTLEIKSELRDMDYFAEQATVSTFMNQIYLENDNLITFDFNGRYRTYYLIEKVDDESENEEEVKTDYKQVVLSDDQVVKSNDPFWSVG